MYYISQPSRKATLEEQASCLVRALEHLADKRLSVELDVLNLPMTLNLTFAIHVWNCNAMWTGGKQASNREELEVSDAGQGGSNANNPMGYKWCANREKIRKMSSSLGELCRIGTMGDATWTTENTAASCHLVLAHHHISESTVDDAGNDQSTVPSLSVDGGRDGSQGRCGDLLVVDTIESEPDRHRIAMSINYELPIIIDESTLLIKYVQDVKGFGFNHIIIIGALCYGMVFLDCYGRVFHWYAMSEALWPLGDYFKRAMGTICDDRIVWVVKKNLKPYIITTCIQVCTVHVFYKYMKHSNLEFLPDISNTSDSKTTRTKNKEGKLKQHRRCVSIVICKLQFNSCLQSLSLGNYRSSAVNLHSIALVALYAKSETYLQ
jgi:hypothetical protein